MTETGDTTPGCSHDECPAAEPADAVAKRRLFKPFRSLKKFFGHRGKRSDADAVTSPASQSDAVAVSLTSDVTTSSSTDVISPAGHSDEPASASKKEHSVGHVSLSMDCLILAESPTRQAGSQVRPGRPADLKLGGSRAGSSDATLSKTTVSSDYPSSLLWKSDCQLTRSFSSLNHTQDESSMFTFHQANAIILEDIEEVFFTSSRALADVPSEAATDTAAYTDCVDLNKVSRSSGNVLSSQAAMHKRAVRPRGRRTLTVYRPYLVQHEETDETNEVESSAKEVVQEMAAKKDKVADAGRSDESQPVADDSNQSVHTLSQEKISDAICLRKLPKVPERQKEISKRRQTITIPDDIVEALADHSSGKSGKVAIQRESSMKLPPPAGQQEVESELAHAFNKFRRHAPEIAQSHQITTSVEHSGKADDGESLGKPSKSVRSNLLTSQKLTSVDLQPDKDEFSQPGPAWKSMSSLALGENAIQKPSQIFQSTDARLKPGTKRSSVALAGSSSDSHSSTSTQVNATCVNDLSEDEIIHSSAMEKCSPNSSVVSRDDNKAVTQSSTSAFSVTQPIDKRTQSITQPRRKSESRLACKSTKVSVNSETTDTNMSEYEHPSEKQMYVSTVAEAIPSSTSCLVPQSISEVSATSEVNLRASCQLFARQKSCPAKTEQQANSAVAHLLSRSFDAANILYPVDGLRSSALWKTDESGNKLEIKLQKSHSIALKPRKNSATADTGKVMRSQLSPSTADCSQSAHQDGSLHKRKDKVPTESTSELTGGASLCQNDRAQVTDSRASGLVQRIQSLKAGEVIAKKKRSSVVLGGSRCDDMPTEPIWLALARQKMQRWTEGKV